MSQELLEFAATVVSSEAKCKQIATVGPCEFCSTTKGVCWQIDVHVYEYEVYLCEDCRSLLAVALPQFGPSVMGKVVEDGRKPTPVVFDSVDALWTDVTSDPEKFTARLKLKNREFAKCLSHFLNKEVTLLDGTEHPVLKSIAKQCVEDLKQPTEKQIAAFIGIYTTLHNKKREGHPLTVESPAEAMKRSRDARVLVDIARRHYTKFSGRKTQEILLSMVQQFDKRGNLSEKQIKYLRYIVEQLPPALLEGI